MSDYDLRAAERAVAAAPGDRYAVHALHSARFRRGLGWEGQELPAGVRCHVSGDQPDGYETVVPAGDPIPIRFVPAGPFLMGSREADSVAWDDEKPQHTRTLPGYWIGKTPVTVREWRASGLPLAEQPEWSTTPDHPVVNVSWHDAKAFCAWGGFTLPSEAEHEKAARGTDGRTYPWGEEPLVPRKWDDGPEVPLPPERASPYGVLGMIGCVWSWCEDVYAAEAYRRQGDVPFPAARSGSTGAGAGATPPGTVAPPAAAGSRPATGAATSVSASRGGDESVLARAYRGGGWGYGPVVCRAAFRYANDPGIRFVSIGFRVARAASSAWKRHDLPAYTLADEEEET